MRHRRRKGIRGLILTLATAVVLVPAANGYVYVGSSSNGDSATGYSQQALRAMNERWTKLAASYQQVRPDDRSGFRGAERSGIQSDLVDRQVANLEARASQGMRADDRGGFRGPGPIETPIVVSSHGSGFDWADAGIGASIALFGAGMVAAAALTRRRAGLAV